MKSYVVGGAVRDRLLGLPVVDRDHVVVGATVDAMLAAGFKPVGRDFPVFLHPTTHEEYALARTERKVAPGYAGFVFHADPTVTLEDDLARRDLTINAMAEDDATGLLVDPFGGEADLRARRFRHVGPAFAEDPVRILRVARFAARFADFVVVDDTMALMRAMVASGEVDALVPERVWQELSRGLMEATPSRMVDVLAHCGALARVMPELDAPDSQAPLDRAAARGASLAVRFALWVATIDDVDRLAARLRVSAQVRDVAVLFARERDVLARIDVDAETLVATLERADAFRRRERFEQVLDANAVVSADASVDRWSRALAAASAVDAGAIARANGFEPKAVSQGLHQARVTAVAATL